MVTPVAFAAAAAWTATLWSVAAAETSPIVTRLAGDYADFLVEDDGEVVVFPSAPWKPTRVWSGGRWSSRSDLRWDGLLRRCERTPAGRWLILTVYGARRARLYEYQKGRLQEAGKLPGRFFRATFHLAPDGAVWILSRNGVAYRWKKGKLLVHPFRSRARGGERTDYLAARVLDMPGAGAWFWAAADSSSSSEAAPIRGFEQYFKGRWRSIPVAAAEAGVPDWVKPPSRLAGAVRLDALHILCGARYGGLAVVDVRDGKQRDLALPLPGKRCCAFLYRSATGRILLLAGRRPCDSPCFDEKGRRGVLLEADLPRRRTRALLSGVDYEAPSYAMGRPTAETPAGVFIAAAGGGLVFAPAGGGKARRIDWRRGFPLAHVKRLRIRGDRLYALDSFDGFLIANWRKLIAERAAETKNWEFLASRIQPTLGPDGSFWHITPDAPPRLRGLVDGAWREFSSADGPLTIENCKYITVDTKRRLWLIAYRPVCFLEGRTWREFDSLDQAYAAVAREEKRNPNFRVGWPTDLYFPAFAGDGRVAYRGEDTLHSFDGKEWRVFGREEGIPFGRPFTPPFYHGGRLSLIEQGVVLQRIGGEWRSPAAPVPNPYPALWTETFLRDIPKDFPGPREGIIFRRCDNRGVMWVGTSAELYCGKEGVWTRFPTGPRTPLPLLGEPRRILVAPAGDVWFLSRRATWRIAHYRPPHAAPRLAWVQPPPKTATGPEIPLRVRCSLVAGSWRLCWRLDRGATRRRECDAPDQRVALQNLPNGEYELEVWAYDDLLRQSPVLTRRFRVKRDYARETAGLIQRLRSPDFAERERAVKALVALGPIALPALRKAAGGDDDDVAWWARAAIQAIERACRHADRGRKPPRRAARKPVPRPRLVIKCVPRRRRGPQAPIMEQP